MLEREINTVLFDLDGTLIDPFLGITKSVRYALSSYGIEIEDLNTLKKFIGPPLFNSFQEYYGFSSEKADEAVQKYREYYSQKGILDCTLYPGVVSTLKTLKLHNKEILLATSKPAVYAERILESYQLLPYFSFISGAELDGSRAQKDEVIAYALTHAKEKNTSKIAMVGDRKYDIEGANKFGLFSIGALYGFGGLEELKKAGSLALINEISQIKDMIK